MRSHKLENKEFLWLALAAAVVLLAAILPGEVKPQSKPAIYDPAADMKALITATVQKAGMEDRNILLMFGGNWCPWCHRLHELFVSDPQVQKILAERYILLLLDVGEKPGQPLNQDLVEFYRVKGFGYPALAVLDKQGHLLSTQSTGVLEKGKGHDPAKVLAFLKTQLGT
jgi:thioredoxin-related protein